MQQDSMLNQLRALDFVIVVGNNKETGKPYKYAKIDDFCKIMNNSKFLDELEAAGVPFKTFVDGKMVEVKA